MIIEPPLQRSVDPESRQKAAVQGGGTPGEGWIRFAQVGRPHGLKGAFFLKTDDNRSAWDGYQDLRLEVRGGFAPCKVTKSYVSGGALAVQLDCLPDRTRVEAFYEARLFVHRSEIKLAAEEHLVSDLVGLKVLDESGRVLGIVAGLVSFGAQDNLRITVAGRKDEVLFPYIEAFVREIDAAQGTLRISGGEVFFEDAGGAKPAPGEGEDAP